MSNDHSDDNPPAAHMDERRREQWERYRRYKEVTFTEAPKRRKSPKMADEGRGCAES